MAKKPSHMRSRGPLVRYLLELAALPLALLWQELVLKVSTTGEFWPHLLFVALFSAAAGLLARFAISFIPKPKARKITCAALMAAAGVLFCVQYFVYVKFKVFYDLNTVTAGAGDAATGFADQIQDLVFSPSGLAHIALFLAPALAYFKWGGKPIKLVGSNATAVIGTTADAESAKSEAEPEDKSEAVNGSEATDKTEATDAAPTDQATTTVQLNSLQDPLRVRKRLGIGAVAAQVLALILVFSVGNFGHAYSDQYSFMTAVTDFGLLTGMRKEIQAAMGGSAANVNFQADTGANATAQTPQDFGPSVMDINFKKLAKGADGTWADLDTYVAGLTPSSKNEMTGKFKGFNLIFISGEAFSAEAIRKDITPTLWRMANKGIQFTDYYQFDSAGTTGGECNNIFGLLPTEGGNSVKMTADHNNYFTMGNALNRLGYDGWAFHNNTYTFYGRDATHNNLGYNNGYMGYGNGIEKWVTWQWPQSDLEMVKGTFKDLYGTAKHEPFNVYYMSVSGHSDYDPGENAMADKYWDEVADLKYSDRVKGYLASNIDLDRAMKWLIKALEKNGMADRTLIVIGADHFPYGLDDDGPLGSLPYLSELYGYDVNTYFERDHNRLIMWSGCLEKEDPIVVDTPTFADDILPTLLNLFGCEWDSRLLPGRDVFSDKDPLVYNLSYHWRSELGTYYANTGEFVANKGAKIPEGYVDAMNAEVANRINYSRGVLTTDYFRHVFGNPEDVKAVHDAARKELKK